MSTYMGVTNFYKQSGFLAHPVYGEFTEDNTYQFLKLLAGFYLTLSPHKAVNRLAHI